MPINIHERVPFQLQWVRQGKVAWRKDWVATYGAARSHIPSLDQHIGFANFDLERNGLPTIEKDTEGDPYVTASRLYTESELQDVYLEMSVYFIHATRLSAAFRDDVLEPLAQLAAILDIVSYHGFAPAEDSPGLHYLRTLLPQQEWSIEFPDGPGAGL